MSLTVHCFIICITHRDIARSHAGTTKAGESFEKFLGPQEYDDKLMDFERFLHASFCKCSHWNLLLINTYPISSQGGL